LICDILSNHSDLLVSTTIPNLTKLSDDKYFLLNPFLERPIFFYKLKTKKGVEFCFNTKSHFYNFEEYLIDRVEKYNKEWYIA
jgi:hypothetical protein